MVVPPDRVRVVVVLLHKKKFMDQLYKAKEFLLSKGVDNPVTGIGKRY